jgi:hypothetical protein
MIMNLIHQLDVAILVVVNRAHRFNLAVPVIIYQLNLAILMIINLAHQPHQIFTCLVKQVLFFMCSLGLSSSPFHPQLRGGRLNPSSPSQWRPAVIPFNPQPHRYVLYVPFPKGGFFFVGIDFVAHRFFHIIFLFLVNELGLDAFVAWEAVRYVETENPFPMHRKKNKSQSGCRILI